VPEHANHPDLAAHALAGLPPAAARAVETHVAECPECRREPERLRATAALLERAAPPFTVPAGLEERAMGALAQGPVGSRLPRTTGRIRLAVAVAAAAVAVIGAVFVGIRIGDDRRPPGASN